MCYCSDNKTCDIDKIDRSYFTYYIVFKIKKMHLLVFIIQVSCCSGNRWYTCCSGHNQCTSWYSEYRQLYLVVQGRDDIFVDVQDTTNAPLGIQNIGNCILLFWKQMIYLLMFRTLAMCCISWTTRCCYARTPRPTGSWSWWPTTSPSSFSFSATRASSSGSWR